MRSLRILSVDDHEVTIVGYKYILEQAAFEDYTITVDIATTYNEAKKCIEESVQLGKYDVLFLDVQLYAPHEDQPYSGEDLGILARELIPTTKIIFMSSFGDNHRINSILKSVNPEGYLVKTDITPKILETALKEVMLNPPYYSQKALAAIRRRMSSDVELDKIDRQILYHLAKGTKNKDLEYHIGLSTSAIENRKRQLKVLFGTENENDLALIHAAKNKGFI